MMEDSNFALLVIGFFVGYFVKTFFNFRGSFEAGSVLVERTANQCLILLGTTVYKVSYMDQLYRKAIHLAKGQEDAKICENELAHEFEIWKKQTMKAFIENYPEDYQWQLEVADWESAMKCLTDIYLKEKTETNGIPQEHNR